MAQASGTIQGFPHRHTLVRRTARVQRPRVPAIVAYFRDALEESRTLRRLNRDAYAGYQTGSRF